jgi:hypothetical protein
MLATYVPRGETTIFCHLAIKPLPCLPWPKLGQVAGTPNAPCGRTKYRKPAAIALPLFATSGTNWRNGPYGFFDSFHGLRSTEVFSTCQATGTGCTIVCVFVVLEVHYEFGQALTANSDEVANA